MTEQEKTIAKCIAAMNAINPVELSDDDWYRIGMAFKLEGGSYSDYDEWSRKDPERYNPEKNEYRWKSFDDPGEIAAHDPVTAGTIIGMAQDRGWDEEKWFNDTFRTSGSPKVKTPKVSKNHPQKQPEPVRKWVYEPDTVSDLNKAIKESWDDQDSFICAIRKENELTMVVNKSTWNDKKKKYEPLSSMGEPNMLLTVREIMENPIEIDSPSGTWYFINPVKKVSKGKGIADEDITDYRYILIESDSVSLEDQYYIGKDVLNLPFTAVYTSGGKSLHWLLEVNCGKDLKKYKERFRKVAEVCNLAGLEVDMGNINPGRMSRFPGCLRNGQEQKLIAVNEEHEMIDRWYRDTIKKKTVVVEQAPPEDSSAPAEVTPEEVEQAPQEPPEFAFESASSIGETLFPDLVYCVDKLLPEGLAIFSAEPKLGKSWIALSLALAVATGEKFMGEFEVAQGEVLYLALEDSKRRIKDRISKLNGGIYPEALKIAIEEDCTIEEGTFLEKLRNFKKSFPNSKLIIIDTLGMVKGRIAPGEKDYDFFYRTLGNIRTLIRDELQLTIMFVHHNKKSSGKEEDIFNLSSGSNALQGVPDVLWSMTGKRNKTDRRLAITGKDVKPGDHKLTLDIENVGLQYEGDWEELEEERKFNEWMDRKREEENEFCLSPLFAAIKKAVAESNLKIDDYRVAELTASELLGMARTTARTQYLKVHIDGNPTALNSKNLKEYLYKWEEVMFQLGISFETRNTKRDGSHRRLLIFSEVGDKYDDYFQLAR